MTNQRNVLIPYFVDIVGPFVAYAIVHWLGAPAFWALTAGGLVAGTSTAINTVRRRGLDSVGVLVLLEILVSMALLVRMHDERLMLIRPSFYTLVAAVYLLYTAAAGKPLTFEAARPIATKGDPARNASYDQAWATSAEFRRVHTMVTTGFGIALIADSILRVLIVYTTPVDRSMWLSNVPHTVAMILFLIVSAMAGRRFKKLVARAQGAQAAQGAEGARGA
jgi:hypothetical protein